MKQTLSLKLGQQLTMTPQLQQAIRLLQLSTLDLQQEIQTALDSNPMLELEEEGENLAEEDQESEGRAEETSGDSESTDRDEEAHGDDADLEAYDEDQAQHNGDELEYAAAELDTDLGGDDAETDWDAPIPEDLPVDTQWDDIYQSSGSGSGQSGDDDWDLDSRNAPSESLQDHLMWQLNLTPMSDVDRMIAVAIIDAIDADGMLTTTIEDITESLGPFEDESDTVEVDEVVAVLKRIQQFDPTGVAARDLAECLALQLKQFPRDTPWLEQARTLVVEHLAVLASRDFASL
jgi:RNA polymerase sigma-54 factor